MALLDSLTKVASLFLATLKTRFELIAVELEEEGSRYLTYFLLSLIALFAVVMTVVLAVLLIIILCWDEYRVLAVSLLLIFFALLSLFICLGIRHSFRNRPKFLAFSREEIAKDIDQIAPPL